MAEHQAMEAQIIKRIERLEELAAETRERMARLEVANQAILAQMATKEDLARLETKMIKWFIATSIALTGVVFTTAGVVQ